MAHMKRGQAESEQMILLGVAIIVMAVALAVVVVWPSFVQSVESQNSDKYWTAAKPFAVRQHAVNAQRVVLEIENTDSVALTVGAISLDGNNFTYTSHSTPFTWESSIQRCVNWDDCRMRLLPGQRQIISTEGIPADACGSGADFRTGSPYKIRLTFYYYGTNSSDIRIQEGSVPLAGICTPLPYTLSYCYHTLYAPPMQCCGKTIYDPHIDQCCSYSGGYYLCPIYLTCDGAGGCED